MNWYIWGDGVTLVNVREGPGYSYAVVASLPQGDRIRATETVMPSLETGQPGWRVVWYGGQYRCIREDLLGPGLPPSRPLTEPFGGD